MLDIAHASRIDTLDTARAYGESEAVIGRLRGPGRFRVTTKLDPRATTAREAEESLETSLAALRTAWVDALLLHRPAQRQADGGSLWRSLRAARDEGRIGRLGWSALGPGDAWRALDDPEVAQVQVASSLLDRRLAAGGFFEKAKARGLEVHVRSCYLQGVAFLETEELPDHLAPLRPVLAAIDLWASDRGVPRHVAFLAWALDLGADRIVVGAEKADQLVLNLEALVMARELGPDARALGESLPELAEDVLDPSRWP
jgi:aryl-alcohol dehydrogenase-like predicted oxidoreductase